MILPNVRHTVARGDAAFLIWLLTRGAEAARAREEARLRDEGLDAILDDPRTLNALMAGREFSSAPPRAKARRRSGSTFTEFMSERSIMSPPSQTDLPGQL